MIQALIIGLYVWWVASPFSINLSFMVFTRPLVSGAIVGLVLGDVQKGIMIGAAINAVYIGYMHTGGSVTADITSAGVVGAAMGILANMSVEAALAFAIPIGLIGNAMNPLMMAVKSLFVHRADKYAEDGDTRGIGRLNLVPGTLLALLYPTIPIVLIIAFGAEPVQAIVGAMPMRLMAGITVTGKLLPAVGYAMLLRYMARDTLDVAIYLIGFVLAAYLKLDIIGIVMLGGALALLIYFRNSDKGVAANV